MNKSTITVGDFIQVYSTELIIGQTIVEALTVSKMKCYAGDLFP